MYELGLWLGKMVSFASTVFAAGLMLGLGLHAGFKLAARWFGPIRIDQVHHADAERIDG